MKIDKSFVDRLARGDASAIIVEALVSIASKLGIRVVAEGVETEDQALHLKEFGCMFAQGYLFSKAVHRDEATALLVRSAQTPLQYPQISRDRRGLFGARCSGFNPRQDRDGEEATDETSLTLTGHL
jgi:hypothetical protein